RLCAFVVSGPTYQAAVTLLAVASFFASCRAALHPELFTLPLHDALPISRTLDDILSRRTRARLLARDASAAADASRASNRARVRRERMSSRVREIGRASCRGRVKSSGCRAARQEAKKDATASRVTAA